MKPVAMAIALMCLLSTSIFAGNMPTVGVADPQPPTTTSSTASTSSALLSLVLTVITLR